MFDAINGIPELMMSTLEVSCHRNSVICLWYRILKSVCPYMLLQILRDLTRESAPGILSEVVWPKFAHDKGAIQFLPFTHTKFPEPIELKSLETDNDPNADSPSYSPPNSKPPIQ